MPGVLPETPISAVLVDGDHAPPLSPGQLLPADAWSGRELSAVAGLVVALDVAIYRGEGFAGYALLFLVAPAMLVWGTRWPVRGRLGVAMIGALLVGLAARSVWCGNYLAAWCGLFALVALAYQALGHTAFVIETTLFGFQVVPSGVRRCLQYASSSMHPSLHRPIVVSLAIVLPLLLVLAFTALFVLANPDVLKLFSERLGAWIERLTDWLSQFSPGEFLFCGAMALIGWGLLRPRWAPELLGDEQAARRSTAPQPSAWHAPVRNALWAVNLLFVGYLAFEFHTLWFREFPPGFHYSGYAHQGAAWLTVALALATVTLSAFFRGELLNDPRVGRLRKLAGVWAVLNVLLAVAVYHRLWIYVGFNGMTRMRTIGFLGTTAVVGGLALVLWKIARERNFVWLVRRQLWVLAAMVYVYAVLPVDAWVTRYNVRQILAGNPAPSVQIAEHANSAEGYLQVTPLLACEDAEIRAGARALLTTLQRRGESNERYPPNLYSTADRGLLGEVFRRFSRDLQSTPHWTAYQIADERLRAELTRIAQELSGSPSDAAQAWVAFRKYAYQWY